MLIVPYHRIAHELTVDPGDSCGEVGGAFLRVVSPDCYEGVVFGQKGAELNSKNDVIREVISHCACLWWCRSFTLADGQSAEEERSTGMLRSNFLTCHHPSPPLTVM